MRKITARVTAPGLLGLLALSALAAQAGFDRLYLHLPPPKDSFNKTVNLDVTGILSKRQEILPIPHRPGELVPAIARIRWTWHISSMGKTYELDLSGNPELAKLAEKLNGQAVRLSGKLVQRFVLDGLEVPARIIVPPMINVIEVTSLQSAEAIRETVTVEIRATLQFQGNIALEGGPLPRPWQGHFVVVNGQQIRLDFAGNTKLADFAHKLTGRHVLLTGRLETRTDRFGPFQAIVVNELRMTVPEPPSEPSAI